MNELTTLIQADSALLVLVLALVIFEGWFVYQGRPQGPKDRTADHVHQGPERSRHEVAGRQVIVAECSQCGCHFNFEAA